MANQAIALQARAPQQGNVLAPAIQQGAQMVNMMRQQQALDQQTAVAQQQMEIKRVAEAREAALAPFARSKAEAEAGSAKVKYVSDFMDTAALALANVRDPQQAMAVGNRLKQMFPEPEFQQSIDETISYLTEDPAQFDARKEESLVRTLSAKDQLTRTFKDQNTGFEQRTIAIPTYGGGPATEVPGSRFRPAQGISYVRGDDGSVRVMPENMPGTGGFGAPAPAAPMGAPAAGAGGGTFGGASSGRGSAGGGAGGLEFGQVVPGMEGDAANDINLTAAEQTSSYNISRLLRGAAAIKKAVERTPEASVPSAIEAAVGSLPFISKAVNFTRGADRQIVAAAQRDVLDALLYLATGAAYNKEQLEGQIESYIPAYSDEPSAIESKRERLAQLVMDAKTRAGRAWTPELDEAANTLFGPTAAAAPPATTSTAPKIGAVAEGYRFKGGNPADSKNWEKVR